MVDGKRMIFLMKRKIIRRNGVDKSIDSRLARCNDPSISNRSECVGVFMRRVFVTKMKLRLGSNESHAAMLVPRVW